MANLFTVDNLRRIPGAYPGGLSGSGPHRIRERNVTLKTVVKNYRSLLKAFDVVCYHQNKCACE